MEEPKDEHRTEDVVGSPLPPQPENTKTYRGIPNEIIEHPSKAFSSRKRSQSKEGELNFLKIGSNGPISIQPSILHFPGFEIGKTYRQTVSILNVWSDPQRVRVIPPATYQFRSNCELQGSLSKGIAEQVTIEFTPTEYKYHYDCLRVHCKNGEPLLLPIHAYPVANEIKFPKRIDLGVCEVGKTVTKTISLSCKVPVDFEYELRLVHAEPSFTVSPTKGWIPGRGQVDILVSFTPSRFTVQRLVLKLEVSQYGSKPMLCEVVGSCEPGITQDRLLQQVHSQWKPDAANSMGPTLAEAVSNERSSAVPSPRDQIGAQFVNQVRSHTNDQLQTLPKAMYEPAPSRDWRGVGSGAVVDPGGEWLADQRRLKKKSKPATPADERKMMEVDGYRIPKQVLGVQAANYVLTQEIGKFKIHELRKAIEDHRRKQDQEQSDNTTAGLATHIRYSVPGSEETKGRSGQPSGSVEAVDIVSKINAVVSGSRDASTTRQLKELAFLQYTKAVEEAESRLGQSQRDNVGEMLLSIEQQSEVIDFRKELEESMARTERAKERVSWKPQQQPPSHRVKYHIDWIDDLIGQTPEFDVFQNNLWVMRRNTINRFVRIVGRIIIQNRGKKRIKRIKDFLGDAKDRNDVRKLVELDSRNPTMLASENAIRMQRDALAQAEEWMLYKQKLQDFIMEQRSSRVTDEEDSKAQEGAEDLSVVMPKTEIVEQNTQVCREPVSLRTIGSMKLTSKDALGCVHPSTFPLHEMKSVSNATSIEVKLTEDFVDPVFYELREPETYKLCEYDEVPNPSFNAHIPICRSQPLRKGALEECGSKPSVRSTLLQGTFSDLHEKPGILETKNLSCFVSPPKTSEYLEMRSKVPVLEPVDTIHTEVSAEFVLEDMPFEPKSILHPNFRISWSKSIDMSSINTIARMPVLSERWKPSRQRNLLGNTRVLQQESPREPSSVAATIWNSCQVPEMLSGPLSEDELSDCESEFGDEGFAGVEPEDPTTVFSQFENAERSLLGDVVQDSNEDESDEAESRDLAVEDMPRVTHLNALHRYNMANSEDFLCRLPDMLSTTDSCIQNPQNKIL